MQADYVIVGAGSAGCAIAYRLAEAGKNVLIIEHGGSDRGPFIQMPAALSYPMNMKMYDWGLKSDPEPHLCNRQLVTPRGKVIGGSSSINGMIYVRGHACDFDHWATSGAHGWSYADVLPYFKRMEHWHDGGHGGASTTVARNGFVPPYVRKAFTGPNGGQMPRNGGGGGNNAGQQRNGGNNGRTMNGGANDANDEPPFSEQVMRRLAPNDEPIPDELLKMDRDIVERVVSEILEAPAAIQWKDIAGLRHAKAAVQELAVWPLMKPELFRGARSVPRGLLLFGPPGTGKTLIGRAVASQCGATFFR